MGKYIRKCGKRAGEAAVMEVAAQVGVRTRGRAMAAAKNKRRKICTGELVLQIESQGGEAHFTTPENSVNFVKEDSDDPCASAAASVSSCNLPASCCSSNGSTDKLKCSDLEEDEESFEIDTAGRCNSDRSRRREATPTSEFQAESGELESTAKPSSVMIYRRRTIPAAKMPPAAELEEFFAAAEKDLHKSFQDKYNYDIVKDVPLEGRFEWVQLKP